ncbi:MAG: Do family serine endopeptidase [Bacteroidota bacterium]
MKKVIQFFLIAVLGGVTALSLYHLFVKEKTNTAGIQLPNNYPVKFVNMPGTTPETMTDFTKAAEISLPAVVHVKTESMVQNPYSQYFFYDPFHNLYNNNPRPQVGSGSGVIISGDGYIVTNNHVIKNADKIEVVLFDKRTYSAQVIGKDGATDIALLKINEQNLPYLIYGNSDYVKVGEWVLAVGNPFNLTSTVTAGIVSAKARNINALEYDPSKDIYPIESFIQTDAAVNPGNSGGALVNTSGQLIGINSAIASNTGSYTGYSFAVPVNIVKKVVNDLIEFGSVQRAFLGISISNIDSKLVEEKKLSTTKGVYIMGITENGGAAEAGMREGDIVIKVGDAEVNNISELQEQISRFRPGDKINVTIKRDGDEKILAVVLKSKSGDTKMVKTETSELISILGATFESISDADKKHLGIDHGVKISSLKAGKLRSAGIKEGFIIMSIDKKKINLPDDVKSVLENKEGGILIEGIYPNGMRAYYAFGI